MDPAPGRPSSGMNKSKPPLECRYVHDRISTRESLVDSTLRHNPPLSYASCPHYDQSIVAPGAVFSPSEPQLRPPYSTNFPASQEHPFQLPPLHSEPTPHAIETSSTARSPRMGSFPSSLKYNRKRPESNREAELKRFKIHSRTPLPDSILPSAHRAIPMNASVPSGFAHLLHPQSPPPPPPPPPPQPPKTNSNSRSRSRFRLFVRQQPIAARACGFREKCRRPIDPLPVIQLLMTDFSPISKEDRRQLTSEQHVVACHLFPAREARRDNPEQRIRSQSNAEHRRQRNELGSVNDKDGRNLSARHGKILSGRTYASPFSVDEDPDPAHAPPHPCSVTIREKSPGTTLVRPPACSQSPNAPRFAPAAFFIFSDLCVRTVGWYQLRFQLVDIQEVLQLGSAPIHDEVWSQPFRVFAAKDFPGMRPTPYLAMRLTSLGAVGIKTREKGRVGRKAVQRGSDEVVDPGRD
ncbi:hypothetical protein AJ78_05589 [Emergomyces pasteurianus Ep9510]|uniref:Velvet domain-containing protein n=1 Tax=Emergomyces pasteurianus Ep9510 TaxID=1447872 RepID=A0A1J9PDD3_9EURO|nr:hypothetical protein AJ78_05589 [Emergomyces pasteurianus Ep9510]